MSLSARRAWIEIICTARKKYLAIVALRKESVDRNLIGSINRAIDIIVALRKESVDRNRCAVKCAITGIKVALRKESVDRNQVADHFVTLSAVALRKESVDRNQQLIDTSKDVIKSLSARRAWIEITQCRL